jgi:glutamyl-tRNA reductase
MISQLTIVHRRKPETFEKGAVGFRVFATCLRSLAISFSETEFSDVRATDQIFRGEDAYRFLLEVTCGLQSPIVGETEVFGQFRHFADQWSERNSFFQNLYADIKAIRQAHLSHLGSQSYGSWVRKQVSSTTPVHIVGTGQLAGEVLIWLRKQNANIKIYSRSPKLSEERLRQTAGEAMNGQTVQDLSELSDTQGAAVIVASPLTGERLGQLIINPKLLIDLRDDSTTDAIKTIFEKRFCLADIFSEIEKDRSSAKEKVAAAHAMVDEMVTKRFQSQTVRPFGWDDLCA